jgi:hypothetical protein
MQLNLVSRVVKGKDMAYELSDQEVALAIAGGQAIKRFLAHEGITAEIVQLDGRNSTYRATVRVGWRTFDDVEAHWTGHAWQIDIGSVPCSPPPGIVGHRFQE